MAAALLRRGTGLCFKCIHREVCRLVWKPQVALLSSKPSDPRKQLRRTHIKKAKPKPAVDVAKLLEQLFSQRRHDTSPPAGRASTRPATMKTTLSTTPPSSKTKPAVSVSPKASPPFRTSPLSPPTINVSAKSASPPLPKSTVGISTKISPSSKLTSPLPFIVSDMTTQVASMERPPAETIEATVETSTGSGELTAARLPLTVETLASTVTVEPLVESVTAPISDTACNAFPVEDTIEPTVDSPLETLETRAASVEGTVEPRVEPAVDTATQAIETKTTDPGADMLSQTALIETNTIEFTAMSVKSKAETTVESSILSSGTVVGRREAEEEVEERAGEEEAWTVPEAMTLESVTLAEVKALVESLPIDALLQTKATLDDKAERLARDAPVQTGSGAEHEAATETQNLSEIFSERDSLSEDVEALEAETDMLMEELLCSVPKAVSKKPSSALHGAPLGERRDTMWREVEGEVVEEEVVNVLGAMNLESITPAEVEAAVGTLETDVLKETTPEKEILEEEERMEEKTGALPGETTEADVSAPDSLSEAADALEAEMPVVLEAMFCSTPGPMLQEPTSQNKASGDREAECGRTEKATGQDSVRESAIGEEERAEEGGSVPEALESVALAEVEAEAGTLESLQAETDMMEELLFSAPGCATVVTEAPIGREVASEGFLDGKEIEVNEALTLESLTLSEVEALVDVVTETKTLLETEAEVEAEAGTLESLSPSEALQAETDVMEELLVSDPGRAVVVTEAPIGREVVRGFLDGKEIEVKEALTLESLTLSEVEALVDVVTETKTQLETEAEVEAEAGTLESLQAETDAMEELLVSDPGQAAVVTEAPIGQEVVREGFLGGKVAKATPAGGGEKGGEEIEVKEALMLESITMSEVEALVDVLTETKTQLETAAETSDAVLQSPLCPVAAGSDFTDSATTASHPAAPSALEEVTGQEEQGTGPPPAAPAGRQQEVETEEAAEETEALGTDEGLDPVQRLFLEKIREYNNNRRLCGGAVEEGPDYEKRLSEEKAKLQRLYGGGDLSSFPEFTFTEPKLDQDFT